MKKLMACAMFAMTLCYGTQATAQSVNGTTGATQKVQNDKQRPPFNGDFCPCPCCRKDMQKDSKNNQKKGGNMRSNGQQGQMQGYGMPPRDQNMKSDGTQANGQNSSMRRPPMSAENCKCGSKCKKCDCNNSSSKKSKKNKSSK